MRKYGVIESSKTFTTQSLGELCTVPCIDVCPL